MSREEDSGLRSASDQKSAPVQVVVLVCQLFPRLILLDFDPEEVLGQPLASPPLQVDRLLLVQGQTVLPLASAWVLIWMVTS